MTHLYFPYLSGKLVDLREFSMHDVNFLISIYITKIDYNFSITLHLIFVLANILTIFMK